MTKRLLIILFVFVTAGGLCAENNTNILTINSEILQEQREIWVQLPKYYKTDKTYAVLYVLDAQSHFHMMIEITGYLSKYNRIPELIVVGIPLIESDDLVRDRIRDYSPTFVDTKTTKRSGMPWQKSGQAHNFRAFLKNEVIPLVNQQFNTKPFSILAGHSQGGLFATDTITKDYQLFNSYIAASPSFWWDNEIMVKNMNVWLNQQNKPILYFFSVADGDKTDLKSPVKHLQTILDKNPSIKMNWEYQEFENETHSSTVLKSYYQGLIHTFRHWPLSDETKKKGMTEVLKHFKKNSNYLGYTIRPDERLINGLGYESLYQGDLERAIDYFQWNTLQFPDSSNAYDSLGEGFYNAGKLNKALTNYQKAVERNPVNLNAIKMIKKIKQEMKSSTLKARMQ